jgi:hypothetical protein
MFDGLSVGMAFAACAHPRRQNFGVVDVFKFIPGEGRMAGGALLIEVIRRTDIQVACRAVGGAGELMISLSAFEGVLEVAKRTLGLEVFLGGCSWQLRQSVAGNSWSKWTLFQGGSGCGNSNSCPRSGLPGGSPDDRTAVAGRARICAIAGKFRGFGARACQAAENCTVSFGRFIIDEGAPT